MRKFSRIAWTVLSVYLLLSMMLYLLQERMIFLPTKLPQDYEYTFRHEFEELNLRSKDNATLNALHFKHEESKGLILYFHGNAGDLSRWGEIVTYFVDKKYDVLVMDYRTFGKSTGKLSEENLHDDAQLFYEYAKEKYAEESIILYGRSLGSGIAVKLASERSPGNLVLETPYFSLLDVAKKRFPFLPVQWLLKYELRSNEYIGKVQCPITIFHGTEDRVVPYDSGKRLFNEIRATQKKLYTVDGGGHNNLSDYDTYTKGIDALLK